jgi:hypothetical protein
MRLLNGMMRATNFTWTLGHGAYVLPLLAVRSCQPGLYMPVLPACVVCMRSTATSNFNEAAHVKNAIKHLPHVFGFTVGDIWLKHLP